MDRETELRLIDELLEMRKTQSVGKLNDGVKKSPLTRYTDVAQFDRELTRFYLQQPMLAAHSSQLPEPGSFLRRDWPKTPMLLTRDRDGQVHAMLNVCRHRGAELVSEHSGCKNRLTCPYHAWTYDLDGSLKAVTRAAVGFPELEKDDYGLTHLACEERDGWIWVMPTVGQDLNLTEFLAGMGDELSAFCGTDMEVFAIDERVWNSNWKLMVEGGLEAYHFSIAHSETLGPFFHDNLSSYERFGQHFRSVLAKKALDSLPEIPRDQWDIRDVANVLYSITPSSGVLVEPDHVAMVEFIPQAIDKTLARVITIVPKSDGPRSDKASRHWQANHDLTVRTLNEDYVLAESIQRGLNSGATDHFVFGRFEGALPELNDILEA